MITAHLPAGYIVGRALPPAPGVLAAAIVGALAPDLDFLRYYLLDNTQVHHHRYWTHIPAVWALIALAVLPAIAQLQPRLVWPAAAFFAGIFSHLLLDTVSATSCGCGRSRTASSA